MPNLPDSGVKTDLGWLSDSVSAQELTEASGRRVNRSARCAEAVRHSGAESCADEQGRLLHRDGNRRRSAVGASPRDGRHGGGRDDAGAGHHHVQPGNAAQLLRLDDLGTVAPGKSADFIVLDANPLDDITNTRKISAVYLRGAAVDRAAIRARMTGGK